MGELNSDVFALRLFRICGKKILLSAIAYAIFLMWRESYMLFSEIIKSIRKQIGITQEQLAHELNVSFSTINRWENGHRVPKKLAIVCLIEFCKSKDIDKIVITELEKL